MNGLQKIIKEYCDKNGTKHKFIAEGLGLTISRYNFLKASPGSINPEELPTFANFFGYTLEDFIKIISAKQ